MIPATANPRERETTESDVGEPNGTEPTTTAPDAEEPDAAEPVRQAAARGLRARLREWRPLLRREAGFFAEVAALSGVVFARPLLASFGQSPETFISRGADEVDVLLFGLAVVLAPLLAFAVPAALFTLVGTRTRLAAHLAALATLGALAGVQMLRINTELGTRVVWGVASALAVTLSAARWRFELAQVFLRYAGLASVVFLVQFLAFSPSAGLVFGGRSASIDPQVTAAVEAAVGEDGPPVVVIMLDALPTASLMDGEGGIDADVYPNLAELAGDGTWYRNHTTVAPDTINAVPAALSGDLPDGRGTPPVASRYSDNLFTLLGGAYDMQVEEQVTALCPASLCPDAAAAGVEPVLRDAGHIWSDSLERELDKTGLPGAFGSRHDDFSRWIDERDLSAGAQPSLYFYHLLLPHDPWNWLPDGVRYHGTMPASGQLGGRWGPLGMEVGAQRHVLQTQRVDQQIGVFFERLRAEGLYDDALIVVTADHGFAFEPDAPVRAMAESQFEQIMWTPLIVKGPGQEDGGRVDDSNVQSIDVLPIVADELGVDLSDMDFDADGVLPGPQGRQESEKEVLDWKYGDMHPPDGEEMIVVDGDEGLDRVLEADMIDGSGPLAAWRRTEHGGLVGEEVAELDVGEPSDVELELRDLGRFDEVDTALPLSLELNGLAWIGEDDTVAIALDGTIAAVVPPRQTAYGISSVRALLWPGAFVDGRNEVTAYQVSGSVDGPALHPLSVTSPAPVD